MQWVKIPLERLFGLVTAFLPGSAVLLLFSLHRPDLLNALWKASNLGYQTKVAIVVLCTFVAGWTLSSVLGATLGVIGFISGRFEVFKQEEPSAKPWYDKNWRSLLAKYLGDAAPKDVDQVFEDVFKQELQFAEQFPEPERSQRIYNAYNRKSNAVLNEFQWKGWWSHFHHITLTQKSPIQLIGSSLAHHCQAASLVLLCALPFTPSLRRWWLVSACVYWILVLVAQSVSDVMNYMNPWGSFTAQMEYLQNRVTKGEHFAANAD